MTPLSVVVSLLLANPFAPKGAVIKESVLTIVAPPSKASLHPSPSLSKSKRLEIPSPSVSISTVLLKPPVQRNPVPA